MSFQKNKYFVLKNVLNPQTAQIAFEYLKSKRDVLIHFRTTNYISKYDEDLGTFTDIQAPNTYSIYGDILMDTILQGLKPLMEEKCETKLFETYSYARLYKKGDELVRHKDRFSCEISTTLNLGGDVWPIFLEPSGELNKTGVKVDLEPGDMLIYRGCELEHWREPFSGNICGQVFLHYNSVSTENAKNNIYDTRPLLGLPAYFKRK
jgi:hypothetical protein